MAPSSVAMPIATYREAEKSDIPAMARIRAAEWESEEYWDNRITAYSDGELHTQQALKPRIGYVACEEESIIRVYCRAPNTPLFLRRGAGMDQHHPGTSRRDNCIGTALFIGWLVHQPESFADLCGCSAGKCCRAQVLQTPRRRRFEPALAALEGH